MPSKKLLKTIAFSLMGLSVLILGLSVWEVFGGAARNLQVIDVPGFQDLELKSPGIYAGIYQHKDQGPMPIEALSQLDVRVVEAGTYRQIPVLMNTTGQTMNQFGVKAMALFNFIIEKPGTYSISALYPNNLKGPGVQVAIISQEMANVRPTLIGGVFFFLVFLALGVVLLVKIKKAP